MTATPLVTTAELRLHLNEPIDDDRGLAAIKRGTAAVNGYVRFNVETMKPGWKRDVVASIVIRVAARVYKNPLEASSETVEMGSGGVSFNTLVGPRLLTSDEREQLDPIARKRIKSVRLFTSRRVID